MRRRVRYAMGISIATNCALEYELTGMQISSAVLKDLPKDD